MPAVDGFEQILARKTPTKAPKRPGKPPREGTAEDQGHRCLLCGTIFPRQPGSFPKIATKMYKVNNYFAPWCVYCCSQYYEDWLAQYGSEARAIRRCCEWLNVYFDPACVGQRDDGIVGYLQYMAEVPRGGFGKKSWDDTLAEEAAAGGDDAPDIGLRSPVIEEGIEVFGEGFPQDAYPMMLRTYHEYLDPLGNTVTATQKKSARFLASLEYRCMEAIKQDKSNASALSSSLTKAIKESGFDTVQAADSDTDEHAFGTWLADIENYTPAEYVKKHPYKDLDGVASYYDRFVRRPISNMLSRAAQKEADELTITEEETYAMDSGDDDGE